MNALTVVKRYIKRWVHPIGTTTVRIMFPIMLGGAALLATVIGQADQSYVRLRLSDPTIEAGSRFSVEVIAYAHVPVNAVDISLAFDEEAVKVLEIDRGQSVITIWTEEPKVENGVVLLSGGTYRRGFIGEHTIATIELEALKTGQTSFTAKEVTLLAGDGQGTPIATEDQDLGTNIFIYDENTSPEDLEVAITVRIITDIDGDGEVSLRDISAFMAAWSGSGQRYDFNGDGRMTFRDFSIILADYFLK